MTRSKAIYTAKIVLASCLAILIALVLHLEFAVSAGVIAILSLQKTKKETFFLALERFLAFLAAMGIGFLCFLILGYNFKGFALFLALYIVLCQCFSWNSSMASNSVLISHFLTYQSMKPEFILNELLIFLIGATLAVMVNLHLGKDAATMEKKMERVDEEIRGILLRMSEHILVDDKSDYNSACFKRLREYLLDGLQLAKENQDNEWRVKDHYDMEYVQMREKQCEILFQMYKNIRKIETTPVQAEKLSHLLKSISTEYQKENTVEVLYEEWKNVSAYMKEQPLPVERKEFESRALLYGLLCETEEFLLIKKNFVEKHKDFFLHNGIE